MNARVVIYGTLAISSMAVGINRLVDYTLSKDTYREYLLESWHEGNPSIPLTSDTVSMLENAVDSFPNGESSTGLLLVSLSCLPAFLALSEGKKKSE